MVHELVRLNHSFLKPVHLALTPSQEANQQRLGMTELGVRSEVCLTLWDGSGLESAADRHGTVEGLCPQVLAILNC